ncbi:MAG: serine/threonine-protein kinase, partial [Pyrinomonadaceae bacterium]
MILTNSRYHILEQIGIGGTGEIFKSEDLRLHRTVAIKTLRNHSSNGHLSAQQILQEARTLASLNHPSIATLYEVDEADDQPFLIMEYVEGETLAEHLQRGPLSLNQSIDIAIQVAEALQWSHAHRVLQGDLKSSNIMVTTGSRGKLLDFGLARLLKQSDPNSPEGLVSGSVRSLAPEVIQGRPPDERSEIFSLGVILYETLSGQHPFDGDYPAETARSILLHEPKPLSTFRD